MTPSHEVSGPSLALPLSGPRAADRSQILEILQMWQPTLAPAKAPTGASQPSGVQEGQVPLRRLQNIFSQFFHSLENDF